MAKAGRASKKPPQRGRPKLRTDHEQRILIAASARRLFQDKGYGRTTTDDIAALCRISKQTLYRLFPGKPALFAAIVEQHRQSMLALPDDYDDLPLDRALEKIFKIGIDQAAEEERVTLLRVVMLETHQYPELSDILRRHGADKSRADLAQWLAKQSENGSINIDNPDRAARLLMDMIFGGMVFKSMTVDSLPWPDAEERDDHVRRCVSVFLNGVRSR